MKNAFLALVASAGLVLMPLVPLAQAATTGSITMTVERTNSPGSTLAISDLSGGTDGAATTSATAVSNSFDPIASTTGADLILNIGSTSISLLPGETAVEAAATAAAAINADTANPYTAEQVNAGDQLKLTAKADGTAGNGTIVASDLAYNGVTEVITFAPSNVTAGETYRITIGGTNYDYVAQSGDTSADVSAALAASANLNPSAACVNDGTTVTCTAYDPSVTLDASATVLAAATTGGSTGTTTASTTLSSVGIFSSGTNASCAKLGDTVTLRFSSSDTLGASTTAMINGTLVPVVSLGDNTYSASTTLNASTTEGLVTFLVSPYDSSNVAASTTASTTDNSSVTFDMTAPTIALNGDSDLKWTYSVPFVDPGASTTDNLDTSVTASTTGSVDVMTPGTYTLTYTATDCAGNTASTTRSVTVNSPLPSGGGHSNGGGGGSYYGSGGTSIGPIVSAIAHLLAPITIGPAMPYYVHQLVGIPNTGGFSFDFDLKEGMSNDDILALQQRLTALGFYSGPETGFFGHLTHSAVVRFQRAHGIAGTGYVGVQTRGALNNF